MNVVCALCTYKQISNCYDTNSYLQYSMDNSAITLFLSKTGNKECTFFPNGVQFNLSLGISGTNEYQAILRDYNYTTSASVIFYNVQPISAISFALVKMFDYGQETEFEIFTFERSMANLQNCFTNVILRPTINQVTLKLTPSGNCKTIFDRGNNILQNAYLQLQGTNYDVDIVQLFDNYQLDRQFAIQVAVNNNDLFMPFLEYSFFLEIIIESKTVTFQTKINEFDGQLIENAITKVQMGGWEESFYVYLTVNPNIDISDFAFLTGQYNVVQYRASFKQNNDQFSFDETIMGSIDFSKLLFKFSCKELTSLGELTTCLSVYKKLQNNEQIEMVFDIIMINGTSYIAKQQVKIETIATLWDSAMQIISPKQTCLQFNWLATFKERLRGGGYIALIATQQGIQMTPKVKYLTNVQMHSKVKQFCFQNDKQWIESSGDGYYQLMLKDAATSIEYMVLLDKRIKISYYTTTLVVFIIGGVSIVFFTYTTIYGIVTSQRALKAMKQSKKMKD